MCVFVCVCVCVRVCVGMYLCAQVWMLSPFMKKMGYGLNFKTGVVLVYGGLRGAIGLALALIVNLQTDFPQVYRDRFIFHVAGFVCLTLVINASTIKYLLSWLGFSQ